MGFLGEFTGNDEIGGEIFLLDKKTLVIKNFKYTGSAPKAYLIGGFKKFVPLDNDTRPNLKNGQDVILQFPYQGDAISKFDDPRLQDLGDDEFTFDGKRKRNVRSITLRIVESGKPRTTEPEAGVRLVTSRNVQSGKPRTTEPEAG